MVYGVLPGVRKIMEKKAKEGEKLKTRQEFRQTRQEVRNSRVEIHFDRFLLDFEALQTKPKAAFFKSKIRKFIFDS
jgi:hypothetical protein